MELFYSTSVTRGLCILEGQEAVHCSKVLRHRVGDEINIVDGCGRMLLCRVMNILKNSVECEILSNCENFGAHPYKLAMAVAPTKNIDRYEWFIEKGTELGMDYIIPVIGECSERRVINTEREEKIIISAAKQSQKALFPRLYEAVKVEEFIKNHEEILGVREVRAGYDTPGERRAEVNEEEPKLQETHRCYERLKMIAFCGNTNKRFINGAVREYLSRCNLQVIEPFFIVMIGPEGDFSQKEVDLALENGFIPLHLGESRLRTETAAVAAVSNIYFSCSDSSY